MDKITGVITRLQKDGLSFFGFVLLDNSKEGYFDRFAPQ